MIFPRTEAGRQNNFHIQLRKKFCPLTFVKKLSLSPVTHRESIVIIDSLHYKDEKTKKPHGSTMGFGIR